LLALWVIVAEDSPAVAVFVQTLNSVLLVGDSLLV
jgi:hypothetical protein